jgi:hypothetical protein
VETGINVKAKASDALISAVYDRFFFAVGSGLLAVFGHLVGDK